MDVQLSTRCQSGVSLIEVMVAFFVLSVGLLGIAGLHVSSLRDNNSALLRSRAVVLAGDMMDRIRANTASIDDYAIAFGADGVNNACHATGTVAGAACSTTEMALHDIWTWKRLIGDIDNTGVEPPTGLPQGQGQITVAADPVVTGLRTATVTIRWQEGDASLQHAIATQIW